MFSMFYTVEKLMRKFHRSKANIRICLDRYGIRRISKDKKIYYYLSNIDIKKIEYFLKYRKEYIQNNDNLVK